MPQDAPLNGGALTEPAGPVRRVAEMQAKLHRWAAADPGRRFDDLFNPPGIRPGGGQAHRQLTAPRRGRALVVVRARESRAHGEGEQQVCGEDCSRGGRR